MSDEKKFYFLNIDTCSQILPSVFFVNSLEFANLFQLNSQTMDEADQLTEMRLIYLKILSDNDID